MLVINCDKYRVSLLRCRTSNYIGSRISSVQDLCVKSFLSARSFASLISSSHRSWVDDDGHKEYTVYREFGFVYSVVGCHQPAASRLLRRRESGVAAPRTHFGPLMRASQQPKNTDQPAGPVP